MCDSPNLHILYVDDDKDACEIMGLMLLLDNKEYQFTGVSTAQKALALINDQSISLFILDYAMPQMTGVELCRLIRQTDGKTPILFYSAMARETDRQAAMAAGATEYLVKPNDLDIFTETVKRLLTEDSSKNELF